MRRISGLMAGIRIWFCGVRIESELRRSIDSESSFAIGEFLKRSKSAVRRFIDSDNAVALGDSANRLRSTLRRSAASPKSLRRVLRVFAFGGELGSTGVGFGVSSVMPTQSPPCVLQPNTAARRRTPDPKPPPDAPPPARPR